MQNYRSLWPLSNLSPNPTATPQRILCTHGLRYAKSDKHMLLNARAKAKRLKAHTHLVSVVCVSHICRGCRAQPRVDFVRLPTSQNKTTAGADDGAGLHDAKPPPSKARQQGGYVFGKRTSAFFFCMLMISTKLRPLFDLRYIRRPARVLRRDGGESGGMLEGGGGGAFCAAIRDASPPPTLF